MAAPPMAAAPPPSTLAHLPPATGLFGLVIEGRPATADFRVADPSGERFLIEVPYPASASEICLFLLPGVALPPGKGVVIYFATPPFTDWAVLGTLHPGKMSTVIRTGWAASEAVAPAPVVQLGLGLLPLEQVKDVVTSLASETWDKVGFAGLVAGDLFNYLSSFAQVIPTVGERFVIPPTAIDKWKARFEEKFRLDPNFLLKKKG